MIELQALRKPTVNSRTAERVKEEKIVTGRAFVWVKSNPQRAKRLQPRVR
jgi:hypothetical protein